MLAKIKIVLAGVSRCAVSFGFWECGVTNKTYDKKMEIS